VEYAATASTDPLTGRGVAIRMAAVDKSEENGFAERLKRNIRFADAHGQLSRGGESCGDQLYDNPTDASCGPAGCP
jgi:hypothetical protein